MCSCLEAAGQFLCDLLLDSRKCWIKGSIRVGNVWVGLVFMLTFSTTVATRDCSRQNTDTDPEDGGK